MAVFKVKGLRRRWLLNSVVIVIALGLVCVLAVSAAFAAYYYSMMETDMRSRGKATMEFFTDYKNLNYSDFYQACATYANTYTEQNDSG
jgi:hypothetical protein